MRRFRLSTTGLVVSVLAIGVLLSGTSAASAAEDGVFRAGAAASNVTPPLGLPIVGNWTRPLAADVDGELYAKCVVLDDGKTRLALVIVDNIGIRKEACDAAKEMIREETGIEPGNVLIAGTHTHSSVRVGEPETDEYTKFLVKRISDGVCRAINNLEPARIGRGSASAPGEVFNRRYLMKPGTPTPSPLGGVDKAVMNPGRGNPNLLKPAGPTDPEIAFLSIQATDGRPIALLANYSLHYVGPAAGAVYSADYFGAFGDRIQELLGADRLDPPFVGIMSNGTSGDINNINWPEKATKKWGPYEKMRQVAEVCAQAVHKAHGQVKFEEDVTLAAATEELVLAVRKPTEEQMTYAEKVLAKPEDAKPYHRHERTYANRVKDLAKSADTVTIDVQSFRIGDWGVCAIPFEVFVEIGLEIKAESPLGPTFVVSHANGTNGYLPTPEQHKLGGYETWLGTSRVEYEASIKIVERLLAMFESLK